MAADEKFAPPPPLAIFRSAEPETMCYGCDALVAAAADIDGLAVCAWCLRRWAAAVEAAEPGPPAPAPRT